MLRLLSEFRVKVYVDDADVVGSGCITTDIFVRFIIIRLYIFNQFFNCIRNIIMSHVEGSALVIGGRSKIGQAVTLHLSSLGRKVYCTTSQILPLKENEIHLDFLDPKSIQLFHKKAKQIVNIDTLIINAGLNRPSHLEEMTELDLRDVFEVNVIQPLLVLKNLVSYHFKNGGRIVFINSIASTRSKPISTVYSSSKSAILGAMRSLALDLAPRNILVNAVCPGPTDSEMFERLITPTTRHKIEQSVPLKRLATPRTVAYAASFLASYENNYITGQTLTVDGGFSAQ